MATLTLTLEIPDDILKRSGLNEKEMCIEVACRLFDAQKLSKSEATRLCGLSRDEFNEALLSRGLPVIRYTDEMWEQDRQHF